MNNEDLIRRAMVAWFRAPDRHNEQPDLARSTVDTVGIRSYVVLRNVNGILAVYRLKSGALRRLIRIPREVGILESKRTEAAQSSEEPSR